MFQPAEEQIFGSTTYATGEAPLYLEMHLIFIYSKSQSSSSIDLSFLDIAMASLLHQCILWGGGTRSLCIDIADRNSVTRICLSWPGLKACTTRSAPEICTIPERLPTMKCRALCK